MAAAQSPVSPVAAENSPFDGHLFHFNWLTGKMASIDERIEL
jgi:hypothetical protein